eukprot:INCI18055.2.p1 GENE.INCI18055.2~~INCI18055.2.p1  ORF type:complete len:663 (-),score=83.23 INCI18055.2:250-2106(-)
MADDLNNDWKNNRLDYMPNLRHYFRDNGAHFSNHVAAIPVCGPSRSSMLLGRYPHNTGYRANDDIPSVQAFVSKHNDTVGRWLSDAGYYTAFLGKYVNSCEGHVPFGWSHWGGFVSTYNFFNATMYDMDFVNDEPDPPIEIKAMTGMHQAHFLVNETLKQVDRATSVNKPFFVSVTPVMPHWGTCYGPFAKASDYGPLDPWHEMQGVLDPAGGVHVLPISPCPTDANRHAFDNQTNPHIDGVWNVTISGPRPAFMADNFEHNPNDVSSFVAEREDMGWRNRSAALLDLDDMLGGILGGLESRGLLNNTVVFFTSDNGYHLGEHKMPMGKGEPYETDIRLPMYVTGPDIPKNVTMLHPTTHLDITATIVELAAANVYAPQLLDGQSFAQELRSSPNGPLIIRGDSWRQFSFSEFFGLNNTWQLLRVVNSSATLSLVWWCTNDTEVFDMQIDPWQQHNIAGQSGLPQHVQDELGSSPAILGRCSGASCSSLGPPGPAVSGSLTCYPTVTAKNGRIGAWSFHSSFASAAPPFSASNSSIQGWAVDFTLPQNGSDPAGTAPSTVQAFVDGAFHPDWPKRIADLPRPDIRPSNPRVPNDNHGFEANDIPDEVSSRSFWFVVLP